MSVMNTAVDQPIRRNPTSPSSAATIRQSSGNRVSGSPKAVKAEMEKNKAGSNASMAPTVGVGAS